MDSVRFGRALGMGARGAAKAVLAAADAVAAPRPGDERGASPRPVAQQSAPSSSTRARRAGEQFRQTQAGIARGGQLFGEAAWGPFVRLGGVLWLELTGVFFGLFVLFAGTNAWKLRGNLRETATNHAAHQHLLWSVAMAALFGYFCVSSFLRASRRARAR